MICILCNRPMFLPAVTVGGMPVGPKCAKRAGLLEMGGKRPHIKLWSGSVVRETEEQPGLFDDQGESDGMATD